MMSMWQALDLRGGEAKIAIFRILPFTEGWTSLCAEEVDKQLLGGFLRLDRSVLDCLEILFAEVRHYFVQALIQVGESLFFDIIRDTIIRLCNGPSNGR